MELNERVEWEVVDTDPALKEVARQTGNVRTLRSS